QQRAENAEKAMGVEGDQNLCARSSGERSAIYRKTNLQSFPSWHARRAALLLGPPEFAAAVLVLYGAGPHCNGR
ncbi:MAG: hypothetical protein O3A51_10645, partial [Verrucomicrobia bacterium]|nr:hypothetical protein [Verrucomicrobiota bacterium]